jgi:hypothetical protein
MAVTDAASAKPFLLVDVDGVLNALRRGVELEDSFTAGVTMYHSGYIIDVPKGTKDRIARLEQVYDCVWATSWEHRAPNELSPKLGFGASWPVITFDDNQRYNWELDFWKMPAVIKWIGDNAVDRKVAWIDDDFSFEALDWAHKWENLLFLHIDPYTGLTAKDTEILIDWGRDG